MDSMHYIATRNFNQIIDILQDARIIRSLPKGAYAFKISYAEPLTFERAGVEIPYVIFGFELRNKEFDIDEDYNFRFELSPDVDSPYQLFLQSALDVLPVNMLDWASLIDAEGYLIIDHQKAGLFDFPYVKEFVKITLCKNTYIGQLKNWRAIANNDPEAKHYQEVVKQAFDIVDGIYSDCWNEEVASDD